MNCFLEDGSVGDFITATFDPIPGLTKLKVCSLANEGEMEAGFCSRDGQDDNYFYQLCLNGRYTRTSCPAYLKPEGFQTLKSSKLTSAFKLHTDTILKCVPTALSISAP